MFSLTIGGIETMLIDIVNRQCQKHEVDLIVLNDYYDQRLLDSISSKVRVHLINRQLKTRSYGKIVKMNLLIWRIRPDIINTHNENIAKYIIYPPAPMCRTCHCPGNMIEDHRKYKTIISISKAVQKDIKERLNLPSVVIENGIDCLAFKTTPRNEDGIFRIVQIGRLNGYVKGQNIMLKAFKQFIDYGIQNVHLDFIGEGDDRQRMVNLAARLNISDYISILGAKDRNYLYEHLHEYDLLVQPSRFEGFGLTVAEAMAAKVPVLVSDIEGPMEIIENGKYGFYFHNGNINACAYSMKEIYQGKIHTDVNKNWQHVFDNYDINTTVTNYENLYHQIIANI
jgi:glycosyltransferase involved in cell wall biosynthesis